MEELMFQELTKAFKTTQHVSCILISRVDSTKIQLRNWESSAVCNGTRVRLNFGAVGITIAGVILYLFLNATPRFIVTITNMVVMVTP